MHVNYISISIPIPVPICIPTSTYTCMSVSTKQLVSTVFHSMCNIYKN